MMRPAFRYYGSKARIAPWIIGMMPPHSCYIEPFFGSGAILMRKGPVHTEIVNDGDGDVVNFFRVVREQPDALAEACRLTPYARDEYRDAKTAAADRPAWAQLPDLERARMFFTIVSQSFASTSGTASGWSCSAKKSVNRAKTTQYYVDRFHQVADRLRPVMIENESATYVIATHGSTPKTVIYCDPPYVHDTRSRGTTMRRDDAGGHGYRHEMTDDDHCELAALLHDTPATVFISGYRSDLYDDLYRDWWQAEKATYSTLATVSGKDDNDTSRVEVVWSNRPIHDGRLPL